MKDTNILISNSVDLDGAISTLGDIETYNEILNDFLDEINEKLSNLNQYKTSNDSSNYAIIAHSIKSDAKYLGFIKLAEKALEHELAGKDNNLSFIEKDYTNFLNEINQYINISHEYLD